MRRLGWSAVLVVALALGGPGSAGAADQARPLGYSDGSAQERPDARWRPAAPSPLAPRIQPEVLAVGEEVLVFGGYLGGPCPPDAGCKYDALGHARDAAFLHPATGLWRPVAPLPVFLGVESAVVSAGKVYVYGRESRLTDHTGVAVPERDRRTMLELDPVTSLWTALPSPPSNGRFRAVHLVDAGGRLLAIRTWRSGGRAGAAYDPAKQAWIPLPADPLARPGEREGEFLGTWAGDRLHLFTWHWDVRTETSSRAVAALHLATGRWKRLNLDVRGDPVAVAGTLVFLGNGTYDPATGRFRALPGSVRTSTAYNAPLPDGIVAGDRVTIDGQLFDPVTRAAVRLRTPPAPDTQDEGFAATPGFLVRFGGSADGKHPTKATHILRLPDPAPSGRWVQTAAAPLTPRTRATAVAVGGEILVFGGLRGNRCPDSGQCGYGPLAFPLEAALYDPERDSWRVVAPMPFSMWVESTVVSGGRMVAYGREVRPFDDLGAGSDSEERRVVLEFDPGTGAWSRLPPPPRGDRYEGVHLVDAAGTLIALRDRRYDGVAGHSYDPTTRRWSALPADPLPTHPSSSQYGGPLVGAFAGGRLYVGAGGDREDPGRLTVAAYDPANRTWTPVPIPGAASWAVGVADRVVFVGSGAHDPATGGFRRLPQKLRGHFTTDYELDRSDPFADGLVVGHRITLDGHLWDPATGRTDRLPVPPTPGTREPASAGAPGVLFRFGGSPDGRTPSAAAYMLRPRTS